MKKKKGFRCRMGWHSPSNDIRGFDGCSAVSICKRCGDKILQDSQGNWFRASNQDDNVDLIIDKNYIQVVRDKYGYGGKIESLTFKKRKQP